jgi:hypothetical protein
MSTVRSSRCRGAEIGVTLVLLKSPAQVCSIEYEEGWSSRPMSG